jgi:poly(3-hydroxybutyrate) depolymerase
MKSSLHHLLALLAIAVLSASTRAEASGLESHQLAHNGYSRPYLVYTPNHLALRSPVVFVLGGVGSTANANARELGWTGEADRNGFIAVFPELVATDTTKPFVKHTNPTFWEMQGSRTHIIAPAMLPVDDDGYLMSVLREVLRTQPVDRRRVFFVGFSSGSGMVQLFASRHSEYITAIAAVATPLMEPPRQLTRPVSVLYIHGDDDEQFSGFEVNSPNFATTPHGNWVTWGYLDGCHTQRAKKTPWGVQFAWEGCRNQAQVVADFVSNLGHEYLNAGSTWNSTHHPSDSLDFTEMAWHFFANVHQH